MEIKVVDEKKKKKIAIESEQTPEQVTAAVEAALANGTVLSLTDDRGRTVLIPGAKIAYVEIGAPSSRRVGFGS